MNDSSARLFSFFAADTPASLLLLILILFPFCAGLIWLLRSPSRNFFIFKNSSRKPRRKKFPSKRLRKILRTPPVWLLITLLLSVFAAHGFFSTPGIHHDDIFYCVRPYILDGDTMDCHGRRVRLAHIDAPEMEGHCRPGRRCTPGDPHASRQYLQALTRERVTCMKQAIDVYDRTVAICRTEEADLSCAMVAAGHAVERYGTLSCP